MPRRSATTAHVVMAVLSAMLGLVGLFVAFGPYLYHALACLRWAKANGVLASAGGALLDWFGVHCGDERSFYVALASVTLRGFEDVAAVCVGDGSIEDGLLVVLEVCQCGVGVAGDNHRASVASGTSVSPHGPSWPAV